MSSPIMSTMKGFSRLGRARSAEPNAREVLRGSMSDDALPYPATRAGVAAARRHGIARFYGLTALGTNVALMGLVGVWVGWAVFRLARAVLPGRLASVPIAAAVGGALSVPAAALTFVGLYAVGGAAPIPLGSLVTAMGAWHAVIGIGEGLITLLVVGALVRTRPDLVHGARGLVGAEDVLEIREGAVR